MFWSELRHDNQKVKFKYKKGKFFLKFLADNNILRVLSVTTQLSEKGNDFIDFISNEKTF